MPYHTLKNRDSLQYLQIAESASIIPYFDPSYQQNQKPDVFRITLHTPGLCSFLFHKDSTCLYPYFFRAVSSSFSTVIRMVSFAFT